MCQVGSYAMGKLGYCAGIAAFSERQEFYLRPFSNPGRVPKGDALHFS